MVLWGCDNFVIYNEAFAVYLFFLNTKIFSFSKHPMCKNPNYPGLKKNSFGRGKKACDRTVLVSYCCIKKCFVKYENNIIIVVDECSFFPILL